MSTRRRTLLQGAAAFAALPLLARAQGTWPNKPIRVIVPFTPGGTTDFVARLVGVELSKTLGQPVIVDNKPGAGTVIGVDAAAKAAPDGYTFVCVANSFTANQTLIRKLPYDTQKDLRPVALMGMSEHVLATHPASSLKTLADLRNQAKAKPGTLSFASFGNGTSAHLSGEMLKLQMGLDIVHVPYKGQGPALTDLLGGQVTMMFGNLPEFRSHIQNGRLVALGMATAQRSQYAPAIPTLAEQGVPIESIRGTACWRPRRHARRRGAAHERRSEPRAGGAGGDGGLPQGGIASLSGTPERLRLSCQSEIAKYGDVIRKANIQVEG